jgi:hypothetical protein
MGIERSRRSQGEKLHNKELTYQYFTPNIIQIIESRRMRWAGHAVRMVDSRGACRVLVEKLEGSISHNLTAFHSILHHFTAFPLL